LFHKHVRVVSFDANRNFADEKMRKLLQRERDARRTRPRRHAADSFTEKYLANVQKRYEQYWNRYGQQYRYAQRVHDQFPHIAMNDDYSLVALPTSFSWGASKHARMRRPEQTGPLNNNDNFIRDHDVDAHHLEVNRPSPRPQKIDRNDQAASKLPNGKNHT
jgi:hypothetical protein